MKTVKAKLFSGFAVVVFLILFALSLISIELFSYSKENEVMSLLDETTEVVRDIIEQNNDKSISEIDKYINLKNQFLIVLKNDKIIFTNKSNYKTRTILEEIYEDFYEEKYNRKESESKYFSEEGYIFVNELIEKSDSYYEIFAGIDDDIIEEDITKVSLIILFLNITIFIILLILGYILIGRTIKPLKLILTELNSLQSASDLSKRLKEAKTNDEFEEIIDSFNTMLTNIERSVENIKQFSSDASHELKTPLTIIQGQIELCKKEDITKLELQETIDKIDVEQRKLQDIIQNFLLLSRLEKEVYKHSVANLDSVIFSAIEANLDSLENKNLELKLDIQEDLEIKFDEKYLNIVINNLLTNAIKYTNEGFIKIKAKKINNKTIFEVKDSGIGISEEDIEKVFERFYRVDKARTTTKDGIGLGLSIVKKICERFETKIHVKSKIKEGTSFILEFKS